MTYFLNQCHATKLTDSKSRMKVIKVNSKIKHKCKAVLGVTRNLILDLVFYFVMPYTAYMKHYTPPDNLLWQTIYNSSYIQKFFKIITMKNDSHYIM